MPVFLCQLTGKPITTPVVFQGNVYDKDELSDAVRDNKLTLAIDVRNDVYVEQFLQELINHCAKSNELTYEQFKELYACPITRDYPAEDLQTAEPILCSTDGHTYSGETFIWHLANRRNSPINFKPINTAFLVTPHLLLSIHSAFQANDHRSINLNEVLGEKYRFSLPTPANLICFTKPIRDRFWRMTLSAVILETLASVYLAISQSLLPSHDIFYILFFHPIVSSFLFYNALKSSYLVNRTRHIDQGSRIKI